MKVRMLQTGQGSPDGIHVLTYVAESIVELPQELAQVFIGLGWAEAFVEVPAEPVAEARATKVMAPSSTKPTKLARRKRR